VTTQDLLKKLGRDLIVLFFGFVDLNGDGALAKMIDETASGPAAGLHIAPSLPG
jgi:hypothetical protein